MRRADFCRAEQTRRRRVAHAPKFSEDGFEAKGDMPRDVFEEDPFGAAFANDAGDLRPEVTRIFGTGSLASGAEGLAGISSEYDVEGAQEGPGIESAQIVPDWRWGEVARTLCGDENPSGPFLPFDECAGMKSGFGQHDAQIQASAACAEGKSVPGT